MSKNAHTHAGNHWSKRETPHDYESERQAREAEWAADVEAGKAWLASDPYHWYEPDLFPDSDYSWWGMQRAAARAAKVKGK